MSLSPSRSHWTAAPAMKIGPSRQYVVSPFSFQPTSSAGRFGTARPWPVLSSMKQPVP